MIIHAVLGNPNHPEYGVATIPFPIPHDQYAHCMELLEAFPSARRGRRSSIPPTAVLLSVSTAPARISPRTRPRL